MKLCLLKEKAIWIPKLQTLLLSDVHFGKASHFRKSGIPIPEPIHEKDLVTLEALINSLNPKNLYFLGDLFHSDWNGQWEILMSFLEEFPEVSFHLVQGNHDILSPQFYQDRPIQIHQQPVLLDQLILTHEPLEQIPMGFLNLCGHIHPGIRLKGLGRQSVRLSCFFLENNCLILPAFGNFTGLAIIKPRPSSKIYGITPEKVIPIQS